MNCLNTPKRGLSVPLVLHPILCSAHMEMNSGEIILVKLESYCITPGRRHSKTIILSTNVDKWQSKTLFLAIFDRRSTIVKSVFDCRLPGVCIVCAPVLA